ncbi:MAG: PIG-L family deacetylase [Gammaproteobacteria bacterium]|nr:PIG-L family deacetylase [Gammaproteobacteria bacterium]
MRKHCLFGLALAITLTSPVSAQVAAIYDQGNNALVRLLERLQTTAAVLHVGAHPDDEDSALVAYHARGENARTGYLSLTRGSGGQNIIGPEQSDALGVIRTEELLQARRLDGAEQYFTRANDFGFSKTRSEASRMWPQQEVLGDMVRTIRQFRPNVIVSRWNGTPADGHGHHQFSGYITPLAIEAAADPSRFPDQLAEGLNTWQVQKLYVGARSTTAADPQLLSINTGEYDPLTGRSFYEIGMQGRSQQKTQQMGSLELRGNQQSVLQLSFSTSESDYVEESVFDGIHTSISDLVQIELNPSAEFVRLAAELENQNTSLLQSYSPLNPGALVPELVRGHDLARQLSQHARAADTQRLINEKLQEFEQALILAAGVRIDALSESETLVPGSTTNVAIRVYVQDSAVARIISTELIAPQSWIISATDQSDLSNEQHFRRRESPNHQANFFVTLPAAAKITQPYWLTARRNGATYDWSSAGDARTEAFDTGVLRAEIQIEIGGLSFPVMRDVEYREQDPVRGELRRRIDVVPKVSVEPGTDLIVTPLTTNSQSVDLLLTIRNNSNESANGTARYSLPEGWTLQPAFAEFSLAAAPATTTLSFTATMPADAAPGGYQLQANAQIDGVIADQAMEVIAYPHISSHRIYHAAITRLEVIEVAVADVNVGYIMGSGDLVPASLRLLGVNVSLLSDDDLTAGELDRYDVIVVGIRASQTREAFVANNQRLLDFAERGGTLVVQYQQPDFAEQNLAPFPASMTGNVRVVDENAPITILQPQSPVFNFPNFINAEDFEGWVQERNNYNFTSFDRERYIPLTEAHDEGEPESDGAMLYAPIGAGHYVYTSYSWFRQLPNGVPGAYRIFANLLSLPASP